MGITLLTVALLLLLCVTTPYKPRVSGKELKRMIEDDQCR